VVANGVTTTLLLPHDTAPTPTLMLHAVALVTPVHDSVVDAPWVMIGGFALKVPIVGAGAVTVNGTELLPPGVVMVTVREPGEAFAAITSEAIIVRAVAATNAVLTSAIVTPLPLIASVVAPGTNPAPDSVTLTVVPAPPDDGVIDVSDGLGAPTANGCAPLVPPVVVTVTLRAPSSAPASTAKRALSVVRLTTVTSLTDTPEPAIATVAPLAKPVPVNVATTLVPAAAALGARLVSVGEEAVTVNVIELLPLAVTIVNVRGPIGASGAITIVAVAVVGF
jgi:hypothetical protein